MMYFIVAAGIALVAGFLTWLVTDTWQRMEKPNLVGAIKEWASLLGSTIGLISAALIFVAAQVAQRDSSDRQRKDRIETLQSALLVEVKVVSDWAREDVVKLMPKALVHAAKVGFDRMTCQISQEVFLTLAKFSSPMFDKTPESMLQLKSSWLEQLIVFHTNKLALQKTLLESTPILCIDTKVAAGAACSKAIADRANAPSGVGASPLPADCRYPGDFEKWVFRVCVLTNRMLVAAEKLESGELKVEKKPTRNCDLREWTAIRERLNPRS